MTNGKILDSRLRLCADAVFVEWTGFLRLLFVCMFSCCFRVTKFAKGLNGDPYGNRTRVTAVKGRCPGPLDERVAKGDKIRLLAKLSRKKSRHRLMFNRKFLQKEGAQNTGLAFISA